MKNLLFTVVVIPLILLISLTVFQGFFSGTQSTFEQAVSSEELGVLDSSPKTFVTAYPAKVDSIAVTVKNVTSGETITPSSVTIDYKSGLDPAEVTISSAVVGSDVKAYADYVAYAKEGYSEYVKTYKQTQGGFNLGSMLPFILIAVVIVGVIIAALARV